MNIISKILRYLKKHRKTTKRIVVLVIAGMFIAFIAMMVHYNSLYQEQSKVNSEFAAQLASAADVKAELDAKVVKQAQQINAYKVEAEQMKAEISKLETDIEALNKENQELSKKLANSTTYPDSEYRQSTYVWRYLKSLGLNDYVCAGILGNIMAEVGGQTLDISKYSTVGVTGDSKNYFGICQWSGSRKDRLFKDFGTTLEAQCKFLGVELFEVIPKSSSFYDMQNEKDAALYFAKYYERCSSGSYHVRQTNATKALNYFTSDTE